MTTTLSKKMIEGRDTDALPVKGRVILTYQDALRSGTNEYVTITMLLVVDTNGDTHSVRPRDVNKVIEE